MNLINSDQTLAAAILAGGQAKRLNGLKKGEIKINSTQTIIDAELAEIKSSGVFNVVIVANDETSYLHYGVKVIPDLRKEQGALIGIESALNYYSETPTNAVLFLPCDLPFFSSKVIIELKKNYEANSDKIIYAETKSYSQPLCAIIPITKLSKIRASLNNNKKKLLHVFLELGAISVKFTNERYFFNVNTLDDLKQLP